MTSDQAKIGRRIQDYVRAKWRRPGVNSADEVGQKLDPALRERVDLLGTDDERLLAVRPVDVLGRIAELEREALLEDLGVSDGVKRVRSREEIGMGVADRSLGRTGAYVRKNR